MKLVSALKMTLAPPQSLRDAQLRCAFPPSDADDRAQPAMCIHSTPLPCKQCGEDGSAAVHASLTIATVGLADWQVVVLAQLQLLASVGGQVHVGG
jgi:hypothetical protein